MPLYVIGCACGHEETKFTRIADRDAPLSLNCPKCGDATSRFRKIQAPATVSDGITNGGLKVPETFKDVLRELKKDSGRHCTIDV